MSDFTAPASGGARSALPPLAAEDFVCARCALDYSELSVEHAAGVIRGIPTAVRDAVFAVPENSRRERPSPQVWSVTEYVCHLRDVYASFTIRLHRARTEDRPALEPMFNDLRARRFRYNERDVVPILDELAANAAGFGEEIGRVDPQDWDRIVTRLPGERRSARWLVRQAMHEGVHHLADIRAAAAAVEANMHRSRPK
ncbi:DinB family protein [Mycobacterium sp. 663a-19]|uniref:DinB family protein n=1 Tax=Mycobacterium sp. 663a-19 TaxID=2986148 RepID=UPI002D1F7877|nr:DinB family protein [Mycobacterium sp. 663a-19]MEB3980014.1 DinB family protein [Mycobacterium sp. 663a-19]